MEGIAPMEENPFFDDQKKQNREFTFMNTYGFGGT